MLNQLFQYWTGFQIFTVENKFVIDVKDPRYKGEVYASSLVEFTPEGSGIVKLFNNEDDTTPIIEINFQLQCLKTFKVSYT